MKNIIINYDIIDKIHQAKGNQKFKICLKNTVKLSVPFIPGYIMGSGIVLLNNKGIPDNFIASTIIYYGTIAAVSIFCSTPLTKKQSQAENITAYTSLYHLTKELKVKNITTSPNLLINAYSYKKKYKLKIQKKQLPSLIEHKQIIIPIEETDGNIKEITVSQQHKVGSWQYKLSFGPTIKHR